MERLPMRKILEILRLRWWLEQSVRQTALALRVSTGTVSNTTVRAEEAGLTWETAQGLDERELEARVYGASTQPTSSSVRPEPDAVWIHTEYKRAGVTLELLHLEYLAEHEGQDAYGYTAFCNRYRKWLKARGLSMRQHHRAGEKVFVDFSGKRPSVFDPLTGREEKVELFAAVLGASSFTYAEATRDQTLSK